MEEDPKLEIKIMCEFDGTVEGFELMLKRKYPKEDLNYHIDNINSVRYFFDSKAHILYKKGDFYSY